MHPVRTAFEAAIALGANLPSHLGAPAVTLREAIRQLGELGHVLATSGFFETDPVGYMEQPRFTNAAVLLRTTIDPLTLLHALLDIERVLGRDRSRDTSSKGPRTMDLDLLLYRNEAGGSLVLNDPDLVLPHPAMHERLFVLDPLTEIAPDWIHPLLRQPVRTLRDRLREAARPLGAPHRPAVNGA